MNPLNVSEWTLFWVAKVLHVMMIAVIPYFYMSLGKLVIIYSYNILCMGRHCSELKFNSG